MADYFDIILTTEVDEYGHQRVRYVPVTTPPQYDDLAPSDMSLENQQKAGVQLNRVSAKANSRLKDADSGAAKIIENGEKVIIPEPSPEPSPESSSEPSPEPSKTE